MQPRGIISYIRTEEAVNTPKEKIVEHLLSAGYLQADIDEAFRELKHDPGMEKAGIFSDLVPSRRPERHVLDRLFAFIVFNIILFAAFSFLYNSIESVPGGTRPSPQASAPIAPTAVQSPANEVNTVSMATDISSDDRDQIIAAIITRGNILQSGNADGIRNYLEITASAQYRQRLDAMSDSDISSLAATMTAGESYVTGDALDSAQSVWQRLDASSVQVTLETPNGSVVRTANEANGVWY